VQDDVRRCNESFYVHHCLLPPLWFSVELLMDNILKLHFHHSLYLMSTTQKNDPLHSPNIVVSFRAPYPWSWYIKLSNWSCRKWTKLKTSENINTSTWCHIEYYIMDMKPKNPSDLQKRMSILRIIGCQFF
jgi:hypothetical protein